LTAFFTHLGDLKGRGDLKGARQQFQALSFDKSKRGDWSLKGARTGELGSDEAMRIKLSPVRAAVPV
jgi:hypothetical protein